MSVSVCPIALVNAPLEQAWIFLSEPVNFSLWWDAQTLSIQPAGPAQPGQRIHAQTTALGKRWDVYVSVESLEA